MGEFIEVGAEDVWGEFFDGFFELRWEFGEFGGERAFELIERFGGVDLGFFRLDLAEDGFGAGEGILEVGAGVTLEADGGFGVENGVALVARFEEGVFDGAEDDFL